MVCKKGEDPNAHTESGRLKKQNASFVARAEKQNNQNTGNRRDGYKTELKRIQEKTKNRHRKRKWTDKE